ncbi:glycosyltransferase [Candidatus Parcubacteria bacterium]|nr:glycosyltransferase [Candidatus Parcubacteria bacterium]
MSGASIKTICFFGIYDKDYSRNRVLARGFGENGIEVIHCSVNPREVRGIRKYWKLFREARNIKRRSCDAILVAYPGHTVVWLARIIFPRQLIIFDAFLSLYDSNVFDRQVYKPWSLRARRDYFLDWYSVRLAHHVLLDTHEHIAYFIAHYGGNSGKYIRVPIGADETVFYPRQRRSPQVGLTVHFHGNFIPLQGVKYIIEAAQFLEDEHVIFSLIGSGQDFKEIQKIIHEKQLERTVILHGKKSLEEIPQFISNADICLGIFGNTEKTQRVIPNKVYEYMAMEKPIITADTASIRELLTDGKNVVLCKAADPEDLARKIILLKGNTLLAHTIATASHHLFKTYLTSAEITKSLLQELRI